MAGGDVPDGETNELLIVWTSGDRNVALGMVFMYAGNSMKHGWWEGVTLLVWGASQKLLLADAELQRQLAEMLHLGVRVVACQACADGYQATQKLEDLGVEVFYTGRFLTDWIRSDRHVITL